MWEAIGLALCCIVITVSLFKSKHVNGSYYAGEVYGMTAGTHRAYAMVSAFFAALFIAAFFSAFVPAALLLGAYALVFIFYVSSFARGFGDEE